MLLFLFIDNYVLYYSIWVEMGHFCDYLIMIYEGVNHRQSK